MARASDWVRHTGFEMHEVAIITDGEADKLRGTEGNLCVLLGPITLRKDYDYLMTILPARRFKILEESTLQ